MSTPYGVIMVERQDGLDGGRCLDDVRHVMHHEGSTMFDHLPIFTVVELETLCCAYDKFFLSWTYHVQVKLVSTL